MLQNRRFLPLVLCLALYLVLQPTAVAPVHADGEYGTLTNPVPIGDTLELIESGNYEYTITLHSVLRGNQAWQKLRDANGYSTPPQQGTEYLLAYVSIKYLKGSADSELRPIDAKFTTFSRGRFIDVPMDVAVPPDPSIEEVQTLIPGQIGEGWLVLQIYAGETYPVIVLGDSTGLTHQVYFAAYPRQVSTGATHVLNVNSTGVVWVDGQVDLSTFSGNTRNNGGIAAPARVPPDLINSEAVAATLTKCGIPPTPSSDDIDQLKPTILAVVVNDWRTAGVAAHTVLGTCSVDLAFQAIWGALKIVTADGSTKLPYTPNKAQSWARFYAGWISQGSNSTTDDGGTGTVP